MRTRPDALYRFHQFMRFSWAFLDLTQREIIESCGISESRRATLWRASSGDNTGLTIDEVRRIVHCVSVNPVLAVDGEAVWTWIATGADQPRRLCELITSTPLYPNPRRLGKLSEMLSDWESKTLEKITCAVVPMLSALPECVAIAAHRNSVKSLGSHGRRLLTCLNNFHRARRELRISGRQGRSRQTHLVFASTLRNLRDGTGPFAGLQVDDRALGIEVFAEAIDKHGDRIGVIEDENVPEQLREHFHAFDGVFIDDDRFLLKVHRHGLHRTFCANIDSATGAYIHQELECLRQLMMCVTHDWKRQEMSSAVLRYLPDGA